MTQGHRDKCTSTPQPPPRHRGHTPQASRPAFAEINHRVVALRANLAQLDADRLVTRGWLTATTWAGLLEEPAPPDDRTGWQPYASGFHDGRRWIAWRLYQAP